MKDLSRGAPPRLRLRGTEVRSFVPGANRMFRSDLSCPFRAFGLHPLLFPRRCGRFLLCEACVVC